MAKPLILLIAGISAILAPFLVAGVLVMPEGNNLFKIMVIGMNALFAAGLLLLFIKYRKVKSNKFYLLGVLAMLFAPLGFAYFMVAPLVSTSFSLIYLLMHFVLAIGILTLWLQRNKIKSIF